MSDWIVLLIVLVPFLALWVAAIVNVGRDPARSVGRRVVWAAALVLAPVIALPAYVILRSPPVVRRSGASGASPRLQRFVELAEARQRGDMADDRYRSEVAALFDGGDA